MCVVQETEGVGVKDKTFCLWEWRGWISVCLGFCGTLSERLVSLCGPSINFVEDHGIWTWCLAFICHYYTVLIYFSYTVTTRLWSLMPLSAAWGCATSHTAQTLCAQCWWTRVKMYKKPTSFWWRLKKRFSANCSMVRRRLLFVCFVNFLIVQGCQLCGTMTFGRVRHEDILFG